MQLRNIMKYMPTSKEQRKQNIKLQCLHKRRHSTEWVGVLFIDLVQATCGKRMKPPLWQCMPVIERSKILFEI